MKKKNLLLFFISLWASINAPLFSQCDPDVVAPLAACNATVTAQISSLTNEAIITIEDLNQGSNDLCSTELDFRINLAGASTEPPSTTSLTITEAGFYQVVLWVIDEAGNYSACWSDVTAINECNEDTEDPVAICEDGITVSLSGTSSEATLFAQDLDEGSYDLCSAIADYRISLVDSEFTEPPSTISHTFTSPGVYSTVLWVIDAAGNWNTCWVDITVLDNDTNCEMDTQVPTIYCINGLATQLSPPTNTVEVWATDFTFLAQDNCTENLTITIEPSPGGTEPPTTTSLIFDTPGAYAVRVWAMDEAGNADFCETALIIEEIPNTGKKITGFVFLDNNQNCQHDIAEDFMGGWTVEARPLIEGVADTDPSNLLTATTNASGYYSIGLNQAYINFIDSVEVRLSLPMNPAQDCPLTYNMSTSAFLADDTVFKDFPVSLQEDCAALQVDISAPFLRRCFESIYAIQYCNYGTLTAEDAYVDVSLDSYLSYLGSDLPFSSLDGNTYTFQLGDIAPGDCGQFNVFVNVSCDAELGQTHCTVAEIFPNEPCNGTYLGAEIEVNGHCDEENEQIKFTITNIGETDMPTPSNYLVVEDVIMYMNEPFQLGTGQSTEVNLPANGSTYRVEVEQPETYPWLNISSATVEGCGENEMGEVTLGVVTAFSQNEAGPFIAIDCQENIGSFDPNDKQAFPRGVGDEHLLRENTDIEYKIRFQNTGTDTAFTVMVLDTLSEWLDIRTVRPGASSHAYSFQVLEGGILEFRFTDILLPDSTTNEVASNGFLQFSVQQIPDNPEGTIIENEAAIYFDYNEPVITNTVFHTIGELFVTVDTEDTPFDTPKLKVYPNPFKGQTTLELPETTEGMLSIYNMQGQVVYQTAFAGKTWQLNSHNLPGAGLFVYEINTQDGAIYRGKIMANLPE